MRHLPILLLLLLPLVGCMAPSDTGPASTVAATRPDPDRILERDGWELRLWYRNRGTRSEGQHGILSFAGREIPPAPLGTERETALGRMKYYEEEPGGMPWAKTGWNFADEAKILPSWARE